jgi:hypothetical protein
LALAGQDIEFGLKGARDFHVFVLRNRELEHVTHRYGSMEWCKDVVLGTNT